MNKPAVMNKTTLAALRGSIKKWEKIVKGTEVDVGHDNCPLCRLFLRNWGGCRDCPVGKNTGRSFCGGSPYVEWADLGGDYDDPALTLKSPAHMAAAKRELRFLKSLLPKAKKNTKRNEGKS